MEVPRAAWLGYYGWLPALIPADARTFRLSDETLAQVLAEAGAEIVAAESDVEIAEVDRLTGTGALAIATIDPSYREGGSLLVNGARRLGRSALARLAAARARRRLKAQGYGAVSVVLWDIDQFVHLPGGREPDRRRIAEHLPQRALIVGRRGDARPTVLEGVAGEVSRLLGRTVSYEQPLAREGLAIALTDEHVLRVAIGPGRQKIELQRAALQRLSAARPPPIVADRVPRILGSGKLGLGDWSAEDRLAGSAAPAELAPELLAGCIDFLVALHGVEDRGARASLAEDAEIVAASCRDARGDVVRELGQTLDRELGHLPRGFGHGDFWTHNLLVEGNRLRGVIDWDAALPGRLPLIDLLHLLLSARREGTREYLGTALVGYQLPWAEAGGDDVVRSYCDRLGIELDADILGRLVLAYWVSRVADELRTAPDRAQRRIWMRNNVELVLDALAERPPR